MWTQSRGGYWVRLALLLPDYCNHSLGRKNSHTTHPRCLQGPNTVLFGVFFAVDSPSHSNYRSPCQLNAVSFPVMITLIRQDCPIWRPGWIWKVPNRTGFEGVNRKNNLLGQWLNFKFFGITYSVGKTKFKLLFQGPLAKWDKDVSSQVSQYFSISCFSFIDLHYVGLQQMFWLANATGIFEFVVKGRWSWESIAGSQGIPCTSQNSIFIQSLTLLTSLF